MNSLVNILLGIVVAWAVQPRNGRDDGLGWWRVLAGALAAWSPHLDNLFFLVGPGFGLHHQYAETWSLLLAPFWAMVVAYFMSWLAGGHHHHHHEFEPATRSWQQFYLPVVAALYAALLLALLTAQGVMPLAPFLHWRFGFNIIYPFDLSIFFGLFFTTIICFLARTWWRDIARIALVLLLGYVVVVGTFRWRAVSVAEAYSKAMGLDVAASYVLPQPISPLNWRLIVETKKGRLHDAMVNVYRSKERVVSDSSTRAWRVSAMYKPVDKAVWRIYSRFGYDDDQAFAEAAWQSKVNKKFRWESRFAVMKDIVNYEDHRCARFKDIRFAGAKRRYLGEYLLCRLNDTQWGIYQAADDGSFLRLDTM